MEILLNILNSWGLIAAIALIYGGIKRLRIPSTLHHLSLGLLFGGGAVISMLQPMAVGSGVIIDCRTIFLGFAGAFVGPVGAALAFIVAGSVRFAMGGSTAAIVGIVSMFAAVVLGWLWQWVRERLALRGTKALFLLGLMMSLSLAGLIFVPLPPDAMPKSWLAVILVGYNIAGTLTLGGVIFRERRRAKRERATQNDAETDPLTGLLNRRNIERLFVATRQRPDTKGAALFLVDIDRFKGINDRFGHAAGDLVLRSVADNLRRTMREGDNILRLGGEEFALLIGNTSEHEAREVGNRLLQSMRLQVVLSNGVLLPVTSSVGAHFWRASRLTFGEVYEAADTALYAAKHQGRDRLVFTEDGSPKRFLSADATG